METKLMRINELLDELIVRQLELAQDYVAITVESETHQKNGFLDLAKVRYIQGSHSISRNCLFSEESEEDRPAIVTVIRQHEVITTCEGATDEMDSVETTILYDKPVMNIDANPSLDSQLYKQFGVLSSGTLKSAKMEFRKCLEKTLERASIAEQSLAIRKRYGELMKAKMDLLSSIPAP